MKKINKTKSGHYFGSFVKDMRELNSLTQIQLAKKLKLSKQRISDIENSRRQVSLEMAIRIARAFKEPIEPFIHFALKDEISMTELKCGVKISISLS